jgi:hypothetical protein
MEWYKKDVKSAFMVKGVLVVVVVDMQRNIYGCIIFCPCLKDIQIASCTWAKHVHSSILPLLTSIY